MTGYLAGATVFELAAQFGIHRSTVGQHLRSRGIDTTPPGLRPDDVPIAAELYREGWSLLQRISKRFGATDEPKEATCRSCRSLPRFDDLTDAVVRLEALFVLAITLGLRPGELRKLTGDHVDLSRGVVHVWRSASQSGDTKTPKSKRSLQLPKRVIAALTVHEARQAKNAGQPAKPGTRTTSSSATRRATCTRPTSSTGGSAR